MAEKHWRNVYVSDYLASWDVEPGGKLILTVADAKVEQAEIKVKRDESKERIILYFEEKEHKPMLMNATNCKIMQKLTGTGNYESWIGATIEVYVEHGIKVGGETVDGLRISPTAPKLKTKPELTVDHAKWDTVVSKIRDEGETPEFFEEWFTISDATKKLLITASQK